MGAKAPLREVVVVNRRSVVLGASAALASLASPCSRVLAAGPTVVRVGNVPIDSASEIYSGEAQGFFSRAGIDVRLEAFTNGSAMAAALASGALDVGGVNVLSLASAHEKGIPLKIIAWGAIYTTKDPTTEMLVPKASPLRSARDLNGKTIGVNVLKGIAHVSAQGWIDKNGGDSKSVRFIEMPFSTMPAALAANRVDAAVVAEPQLSESRSDTRLLGKSYDGIADTWMIDAYVASESWIASNADVVRRFASAMHQSSAWANRNQSKTAEIISKAMKVDPAVVRSMRRARFVERPDLALVQPVIDAGAKYGVLAARFPAADLFTTQALQER